MGGVLSDSAFVSLVYNAALLLVLAFLYDLIARYFRRQSIAFKLLTGGVLGLISIAVMLASWRLSSGVIFDTRSVVLSMGTLFYGTIPGAIAGAIAAVYRASQGGSGAVMGVSVIAMAVIVGAVWRRWRFISTRDPGVLELYLFGLTVHVFMLLLTFTLPWPSPLSTLRHIAVPVIVIYPLASLLLGLLMIDQRRRRQSEEALRESEERSGAIIAALPGGLVHIFDHELNYVFNAGEGLAAVGLTNEDLVGKRLDEILGAETAAVVETYYRRVLEGETVRFESDYAGHTFLMTSAPLRDAEGKIGNVLTLSVDISDRRKAEDDVRRHAENLRRTVEGAVLAMSHVVETRDPYTAGHERRVSELAVAIAAQLGMDAAHLDGLRMAGLIHDVGKIAVPAEILSKPGRLSAVEFNLIKQHAQSGYDILEAIEFQRPVAQMVLQHHERLDGSGYPQGLSGADILPEARILAVADVVEAMSSHRPYRAALGIEPALAEIEDGAGRRYDAAACEAAASLFREHGFVFSD